jgi:hypothetical protein
MTNKKQSPLSLSPPAGDLGGEYEECEYVGYEYKCDESGFTIYLVLILLTIAAILLSVSLYGINSVRNSASADLKKFQARMLAESGLVRAEYFLGGGDGHSLDWETNNYREDVNSFGEIAIKNSRFGVYSHIESTGKRLDFECTINGFFGRDIPELLKPTITLTGHAGGMELKESSRVSGSVVLFHGGIKYNPVPVIIRASPSFPFDSTVIYKTIKNCDAQFLGMLSGRNTITGNTGISERNDSTLIRDTIIVMGDCELKDVTLSNKCFAISGALTIDGTTKINESMFYCEKCIIKNGVTSNSLFFSQKKMIIKGGFHNAQFIASDSIEVGNNSRFGTMALCVNYRELRSDTLVSGGVYLEERSQFRGIIISAMDSIAKQREWRPSIYLGRLAEVNGVLITDQSIFMKDNHIKGHIWARQIESTDDKLSYTNYLFGCIITQSEISFPFPLFGPLPVGIVMGDRRVGYGKVSSRPHKYSATETLAP